MREIITEDEAFDYAFREFGKKVLLSENDRITFRDLFKLTAVKRKAFLLKEGEICKYDYFVVKGCLRSFYLDKDLAEHTRRFAVEGWWTGNLLSFLKKSPSEYHVIALEDTWILSVDKQGMDHLYTNAPAFERYFRLLLQNAFLASQDRVYQQLSAGALHKYRLFQKQYPGIEQRVPQKHIASYLGITPAYLSRLRKKKRDLLI